MATNEITHTAGLLEYLGCIEGVPAGITKPDNGTLIAQVFPLDVEVAHHNAARIVAAWNACDGIATEALEAHGAGCFAAWAVHKQRADDLQEESDELRAALARYLPPRMVGTWRTVPHGKAHVLVNEEGADIGHAYLAPSGRWFGDPWGREKRSFVGDTAETDARAWVEQAFR